MEGVERTNVVMVRPQQQGAGFPTRSPYTMDMDRNNRMCYACRSFGHIAKNYRNREGNLNWRIETEDNSNLKEEWDLIVFN